MTTQWMYPTLTCNDCLHVTDIREDIEGRDKICCDAEGNDRCYQKEMMDKLDGEQ